MNTVFDRMAKTRTDRSGKGPVFRRRRLVVIFFVVVAVMISTLVTADVVLTYQVNTSVGANASSQFGFGNGNNYGYAKALGLITNTIPATPSTITTTISGIQAVGVELYNVTVFNVTVTTTTTTHISSAPEINGVAISLSGLVCAYAFISDVPPTPGTVAASGAIGHCSAVVPTIGAFPLTGNACTGAGSTTGVETINLTAAAGVSGSPGTCNIPSAVAPNHIAEYVTYAIVTEAAVAATNLNTVGIVVTSP